MLLLTTANARRVRECKSSLLKPEGNISVGNDRSFRTAAPGPPLARCLRPPPRRQPSGHPATRRERAGSPRSRPAARRDLTWLSPTAEPSGRISRANLHRRWEATPQETLRNSGRKPVTPAARRWTGKTSSPQERDGGSGSLRGPAALPSPAGSRSEPAPAPPRWAGGGRRA